MEIEPQVLVSGGHYSAPRSWAPPQAESGGAGRVLLGASSLKPLPAPHQRSSKRGSSTEIFLHPKNPMCTSTEKRPIIGDT